MKTATVVFVFVVFFAVVLSGCATAKAPDVQHEDAANRQIVKPANIERKAEIVNAKIQHFSESELDKIDHFLDLLYQVNGDPFSEIFVLVVTREMEFPPQLNEIMSNHPKLNTLPRDPSLLILVESPRVRGVWNIFLKVAGSYIGEKNDVFSWMPTQFEWNKYMDLKANNLEKKDPEEAFIILFNKANEDLNPTLIAPVEGEHLPFEQQWDWERLPGNMDMYVPLATNNETFTEYFKQ